MTEQELLRELTKMVDERKPGKKRITASRIIAFWVLAMTSGVSAATLYLMYLCVTMGFTGQLVPLTTLIGLCQAMCAVVLSMITNKSKAENTKGGITYDAALGVRDL